jgi:hypothetical protein
VVKDTLPSNEGAAALRARVGDGSMEVRLEGEAAFADGAVATARVTGPDLEGRDIRLERIDDTTFVAELPIGEPGTYAVGATVSAPDGSEISASTLASQSYAPEYLPGEPDPTLLARVSSASGGRGEISATQAYDVGDLEPGRTRIALAWLLLLLAALAWPVAVALSRLSFTGRTVRMVGYGAGRAGDWVRDRVPARPSRALGDRAPRPTASTGPTGPPRRPPVGRPVRERPTKPIDVEVAAREEREAAPPETVGRLLERKRRGGAGGGGGPAPSGSSGGA